jgi:hypothetical protein
LSLSPSSEPEQGQEPEKPTEEQLKEDPFEELRLSLGSDFGEYDETALEQYRSYSFYFAQRQQGASRATAKALTCERYGHDAPRGMCRRCGLGVDITKTGESADRKRLVEREAWLASRH